jgi:hypothetical protein
MLEREEIMRVIVNALSIVLVGSWNKYIFTPEWLKGKLSLDSIKMQIDVNDLSKPYRFSNDDFVIMPSWNNIIISPSKYTDDNLQQTNKVAFDIRNSLLETPIRAIGFNINYEDLTGPIFEEFTALETKYNGYDPLYTCQRCKIERQHELGECYLNVTFQKVNSSIKAFLNFHYTKKEVLAQFENKFVECKSISEKYLKDVYKEELE